MEMKWHPIVNGDLSEVPLFDDVLFTIINEDTGELYVICDELDYKTFTGVRFFINGFSTVRKRF